MRDIEPGVAAEVRSVAQLAKLIVLLAGDLVTVEMVGAETKRWWQFWKRAQLPSSEPAQTGRTEPMPMRTGSSMGHAGPAQTGFTEPMPMRADCGPVYQTPAQTGLTEPMPIRGALLTATGPGNTEPIPTARHVDSATIQILCEPPRRSPLEGAPSPAPWASTVPVTTDSGPTVIPLRQSSLVPLSSADEDEVDTGAQTIRRTRLSGG